MRVRFEMRVPPEEKQAVEYVEIAAGSDVVRRRATDADRSKYRSEYAAFKAQAAEKKEAPAPREEAPKQQAPAPVVKEEPKAEEAPSRSLFSKPPKKK